MLIIQSIPFISFAAPLAKGEGSFDVYKYNESTGVETFIASYDSVTDMITAINNDNAVSAHFVIRLNEDVIYNPAGTYLRYANDIGNRTITFDGGANRHTLTLNNHNGILVGGTKQVTVGETTTTVTNNMDLNIKNLNVHHIDSGSAIQFYSHGNIVISDSYILVDGESADDNYTIINTMASDGESASVTITNSVIMTTREMISSTTSNIDTTSVIRTGNNSIDIDITLDGCTIKSTAQQCYLIHTTKSAAKANVNITNSTLGVNADIESGKSAIIYGISGSIINANLGTSMFYSGCEVANDGTITDGTVITDQSLAIRGSATYSVSFSSYTSIGGYNTFPELIITEVHLNSINVQSSAGPFNKTQSWSTMGWWSGDGTHPSSSTLEGEFFRYIEVYNASNRAINLFDYKLVVDTDALNSDSTLNVLDIEASATVGAITNEQTAYIQPGETAILYLYNFNDASLGCTLNNFKSYYDWRYDGSDETLTSPLTPGARDEHLVVDLTGNDTTVLAIDDIGNSYSDTKLGNFKSNSIYYGIVKDSVNATEVKTEWTSWALFERYTINDGYSGNTYIPENDANQVDQSTFNFLYGLDASADIREGRRMNEARPTYNCNPGLLSEIQKLNFPYANPKHSEAPSITITEINNVTKVAGSSLPGYYDYFEVANISSESINIYDYCLFQQYNIASGSSDFSSYWFDRVSYMIPGNIGDIQCYSSAQKGSVGDWNVVMTNYTGTNRTVAMTNPDYSQGVLEPGESAILWAYDNECYAANIDGETRPLKFDDFRSNYASLTGTPLDNDKLIVAISGVRNQESDLGNYSLGVSNGSCSIFGIGKLENFEREFDPNNASEVAENTITVNGVKTNNYPEIIKEEIFFTNPNKKINGFSILDSECVVFMFASMITAGGQNAANLGENGESNTAYQYASAYVNGAALRFAGFLDTVFPDGYIDASGNKVRNSVVSDDWKATPDSLLDVQSTLIQSFIRNSFEITYTANGGSGSDFVQFASAGKAINLSNGSEFSKAGSYLIGWSTDGKTVKYAIGESVTFTADTTLYAIWGAAPAEESYTISIPSDINFNSYGTATITIGASLKNFDDDDKLSVIISSDQVSGSHFLLESNDASVDPLLYILTNQTSGKSLANNELVTQFTNSNSAQPIVISAVAQAPIFSGVYTGTLTFQFEFTE